MLHDLGLMDEVPDWYSPAKTKPVCESDDVQADCQFLQIMKR